MRSMETAHASLSVVTINRTPLPQPCIFFRPDSAAENPVLWVDNRLVGASLPRAYFWFMSNPARTG